MIHYKENADKPDDGFVQITVNKFNDESASEFEDKVSKAHSTGQKVVPVKVSSNGGIIHSCLQMKSAIDRSELQVLTYVPDRAYSCGFALLAFGTKGYRFADPHAFTMDHQAKGGVIGKDAEMENRMEFQRRYLDSFYSLLDEACGKPEGFFKERWEDKNNLDDFLDAEETVELGAADEVAKPYVKATTETKWTIRRSNSL
jgi:ATP-dependent protease ClpP protease subunit